MATRKPVDIERVLAQMGSIKLAYSIDDLAAITPLSRFFWYSAINTGQLPAVKANEKTIVLLWDLIAYFDSLPTFTSAPGKEHRAKQAATLRSRRANGPHGKSLAPGANGDGSHLSIKAAPIIPEGLGDEGKEVASARL